MHPKKILAFGVHPRIVERKVSKTPPPWTKVGELFQLVED